MQLENLLTHYQQVSDVLHKTLSYRNQNIEIFFSPGLCNVRELDDFIIPRLEDSLKKESISLENDSSLFLELFDKKSLEEVDNYIFMGYIVLLYEEKLYRLNLADVPKRDPEQSIIDITISGPRDSFVEDIDTNMALIRKRIKSATLKSEPFTIGRRSQTRVKLLYIDDITNDVLLSRVRNHISKIDIDAVASASQFRNAIATKKTSIFPTLTYTTRPDYCVTSLLNGRVCILVDNINSAAIAPVTLSFFTNFSDDVSDNYVTTIFNRTLYMTSLFISLFLMSFLLAIYSYDPQLIPFTFLSNIIASRKGVIVPVDLEILLATFLFEVFRAAGTRLPAGISSTLLVIGGILLGQITISSGLIGPDIMFFSALSIICTYTISNNVSFNGSIAIIKMIVFALAWCFGLFGFICSFLFFVIYMANLKSYGVPILTPVSPFILTDAIRAFLPRSMIKKEKRPTYLNTKDKKVS